MVIERAMNELESLVLTNNTTTEENITTFSDVIDYLNMNKSSLIITYQVRLFINKIINLLCTPVTCKV